jgi:Mg-chelatase subunit ChlD
LCRKGDYGSGNPIKSGSGSNDSIDIVFVFDTNESMGDDIAAANAAATGVLARLGAKTTSFRGAVVDYRDFQDRGCPTEDYACNLVLDFTSDLDAIKNAFDNLDLGCGGDFAETIWSGLMTAFSLPWRPGVKKISVVFADAPALNPEPNKGYTIDTIVSTSRALDPVVVYACDRYRLR